MSILHSQLAIYGAIDELVIEARKDKKPTDKAVLAAAAKLLPNTTGFGEAGWYRELQLFINRDGVAKEVREEKRREPIRFPQLADATSELARVPPPIPNPSEEELRAIIGSGRVRDPDAPGGFEDQTFYDSSYDPALARAGYGAFTLLKLAQITNPGIAQIVDPGVADDQLRIGLKDVLTVAVRSFRPGENDYQLSNTTDAILRKIDAVDTRQDWTALAAANVSPQFADDSKPCFGTLEEVNGKYCSTVVTDCSAADLSVSDIKQIVDPINWSLCSKFFCQMGKNTPNRNAAGWSRVQEQIGAECGEYRLITDLIFYKVQEPVGQGGSIFINYDIDPQRGGLDRGYVEVDNGYIFVSPTNAANDPAQKGVRIQTSKQEHVDGLSPCATAALACLMGWADAGKEMLAGTARRILQAKAAGLPVPPLKAFYPSDQPDPEEQQ